VPWSQKERREGNGGRVEGKSENRFAGQGKFKKRVNGPKDDTRCGHSKGVRGRGGRGRKKLKKWNWGKNS